jgi:hypothetical protein
MRLFSFTLLTSLTLVACESTQSSPSKSAEGPQVAPKESTLQSGGDTAVSSAPSADTTTSVTSPASAGSVAGPTSGPPELLALQREPRPIRALYVNRFAAQGTKTMRHLIGIADSTEINALVIDVKDEFGLNFHSDDPMLQKNAGTQTKIRDLKALVDSIRAHGILPIARIVVFKDSVAARMNPEHVIRKTDGTPWRDREGLTWVNPYANAIWEYNFRVAEEAIRAGFGEIQFDYIRFPEPYKSLPQQVFPESKGRSKQDVLAEFLTAAKARFDKYGVRTTADVFGLVTTVKGSLEVGQEWEKLSPTVDVILPMVYPSHYPRGSFGIKVPNAEPYKTILTAITRAKERDAALGITTPEHVRPWLQAFTLGAPKYGPEHILEQKRAVYDAGYDGWVLWHPGSKYDIFLPALEKTFVSRKK